MPAEKHYVRPKLPPWIRVKIGCGGGREEVGKLLQGAHLNTVCSSARCPNLNECWHRRTATFMILGNYCTRDCRFCAVKHDINPAPPDENEPQRLAETVKKLGLRYVVVTSVTRDDLPDGGSGHFKAVIFALKEALPGVDVEVLTPDFCGNETAITTVLAAGPTVFNHNIETVERLTPAIRNKAGYRSSLKVLRFAADYSGGKVPVKSGMMAGMGERDEEIIQTMRDLRDAGVTILTIGQYLPPSAQHWPLDRYVEPDKFTDWGEQAKAMGFKFVASAPLVRSSYNAAELVIKNITQSNSRGSV